MTRPCGKKVQGPLGVSEELKSSALQLTVFVNNHVSLEENPQAPKLQSTPRLQLYENQPSCAHTPNSQKLGENKSMLF